MLGIEESKNFGSAVLYGTIDDFYFGDCQQFNFCFILRFTSLQESSRTIRYYGNFVYFYFYRWVYFRWKRKTKRMACWRINWDLSIRSSSFSISFLGLESLFYFRANHLSCLLYFNCYDGWNFWCKHGQEITDTS